MSSSGKGKKVKYSMDPRMQKLLSRNKGTGHMELFGLCMPLVVFIVLEVVGMSLQYSQTKMSGTEVATRLVVACLWGFLIYELCKRGHTGWAWVIVFLPLIFTMLLLALGAGLLLGAGMRR